MSQLVAANAFGVALSIAAAPVVSRLYSPRDVGEFALFTALAGMVTPLFTLRYESAIVLSKSEEESARVFGMTQRLAILVLAAVSTAVFITPEALFRRAGYGSLYPWRTAAVFAGYLTAMIITLTACHNRAKGYGNMSKAKMLQNGAYAALVVTLGWLGLRHGQMLATLASGIMTGVWLKRAWSSPVAKFGWREGWEAAKTHANAPCFLFPATTLDTFTKQLPVFLITSWFSTELAGNFSVAWRMVFLPVGLMGGAVGQVFFQRFAQAWPDRREARRLLFKTWRTLALAAVAPCVLMVFFAPPVFQWALGEKWRQAGTFAALIAPMTLFVFLSSPTSSALVVLGMQKYSLLFGVMTLFYRPACLWVGWHLHNLSIGLLLLSGAEIVQILIYNAVVLVKMAEK